MAVPSSLALLMLRDTRAYDRGTENAQPFPDKTDLGREAR